MQEGVYMYAAPAPNIKYGIPYQDQMPKPIIPLAPLCCEHDWVTTICEDDKEVRVCKKCGKVESREWS